MATAKKTAPKAASKNVKPAPPAKKAPVKAIQPAAAKRAVAKKPVAAKQVLITNEKAVPVKAAVAKKGAAPVKAAPVKKQTLTKTKTTEKNKTTAKPTAKSVPVPAKKVTPVKAPAKAVAKVAPARSTPAKAAAVKAPVAKAAAVKKVVRPEVKAKPVKEALIPKAPEPKVVPAKSEKAARPKKAVKTLTKTGAQLLPGKPIPKPSPAPAAFIGREEKKTNIIVAHRRLENKSNEGEDHGKTMINYKPEFTRSILNGAKEEKAGPIYRYSDEELGEFRELIQNRLEKARKELAYQQGLITRKDEAGTEDTENRYMNIEDGSGAMEREQLAQLASRQIQFINHLEKALIRIENKTYGICRVTGNLIDKNRLRAVPHATLSIEAKNQMNKK
jgi:RNA polymerase-binding transcription factor DksA